MAEEQLSALRKKRGVIKGQLSKFVTFVENFNDPNKLPELAARLEKIEDLWSEFDKIQTQIEILDDNETPGSHRDVFEATYFSVVGSARALKQIKSDEQLTPNHTCANKNVKLPEIKLPEFNGEYSKWIEFNDTFRAVIHNNDTLTVTQKFYYLRSCLVGEAARALDTLEASDANYEVAWDILRGRFENRNIVIHNHIKALFELPQVSKDSYASLRSLYDSMSQHLRALESLGQPVESWDSIIIYLITSKLDLVTQNEWEKQSIKRRELPKMDWFKTFLNERCQILEKLSNDHKQTGSKPVAKEFKDKTKAGSLVHLTSNAVKCLFCKGSHNIYVCKDLLQLSVDKRLVQVKRLKLCTNCLRNNHFNKDCKASNCKRCNGRHNTLLHFDDAKDRPGANEQPVSSKNNKENDKIGGVQGTMIATHTIQSVDNSYILLATAKVIIFDSSNKGHQCRALLDNGSQSNFITNQLAQKLKLTKTSINLPVCGVNQSVTSIAFKTTASIKSLYNNYKVDLSFLIVDNITQELPNRYYNISNLNIPEGLSLADSHFNQPEKIDLLIGASVFWELICAGQIQLGHNKPYLQKTKLGWIISGPMPVVQKKSKSLCHFSTVHEVRDNLERFWEVEECLPRPKATKEEAECETLFAESTERDTQGRFIVQLPFRANIDQLGESLSTATKRFYALERKLAKNPNLRKQYVQFMTEYQELGHMTEITPNDNDTNSIYYLPHHGIIKEASTTTKLRVVFDASAKTSSNLSLNDVLKVGPIIQDDLFAILIRFRMHKYVITADVEKMYRQVNIHKPHRDFQRILWRTSCSDPIHHFKLNTVTYGMSPASFLAIRALQQVAIDMSDKFPDASKVVLSDFYVDDLITGCDTIEKTKNLVRELNTILDSGKFHLRKWRSNNNEIIDSVYSENSSKQTQLPKSTDSKTLGISWNSEEDNLIYRTNMIVNKTNRVTKRVILSFISQLFDPLGLVSPTIVVGKIIMQKIWQLGIGWDESLPLDLLTLWNQFREDMKLINEITVPRHVLGNEHTEIQLHGFSDASEKAYGACIYVRTIDPGGNVITKLLCSKSRVAPLKTISLPRLELCGALLLARLSEQVLKALKRNANINSEFFYWCDSTIVLSWIITEPSLLKTFVGNRVAEIQRLSDSQRWSHVTSSENPADIVSRGANLKVLVTSQLWWSGPIWLSREPSHWPSKEDTCLPAPLEIKTHTTSCATFKLDQDLFGRFSTFVKMLRVAAYCLRFANNSRGIAGLKRTGTLTSSELNETLIVLTKIVQSVEFASEINALEGGKAISSNSKILSLNPFLDNQRVLRVGGRLINAKLPYEHKHPMLLPSDHAFTRSIIMYEHERHLHIGITGTLASVRARFWPLNGRSTVRRIIFQCMTCFRVKPKIAYSPMGNLPSSRLNAGRPFTTVGIDFAGPFLIKDGKLRSKKIVKCYLSVFVCFSSKAVHLELVGDLTSDAFLNALKRFVSRRGLCSHIYSDNATNFVGAKNALNEVSNWIKSLEKNSKFADFLNQNLISWHFIPPHAPNFGGLWEAAVKTAKYHLYRIVGNAHLTFEGLYTVITQIEAIMNSRPLCPMSNDPNDLEILTPGHLLIGNSLTALPQSSVVELPTNRLNQYQHLQQIVQHFWSRWSKEYLSHMQQRSK